MLLCCLLSLKAHALAIVAIIVSPCRQSERGKDRAGLMLDAFAQVHTFLDERGQERIEKKAGNEGQGRKRRDRRVE